MKPEEQQIAIAEACGFERRPDGYWREKGMVGSCGIPDYPNDLNAMHEAEKVLNATLLDSYWRLLYLVVLDDQDNISNEPAWATAAQRAEAFLRTIGKWVES